MQERKVHWVAMTSDKKVGPVMASYSPLDTCPDSCGFKSGGCYAWELFYLRHLGEKISDGRIKIRTIEEAFKVKQHFAKRQTRDAKAEERREVWSQSGN